MSCSKKLKHEEEIKNGIAFLHYAAVTVSQKDPALKSGTLAVSTWTPSMAPLVQIQHISIRFPWVLRVFVWACQWCTFRCPESLRPDTVRPCLLPCKRDCIITPYSDWSPCPSTCQPGSSLLASLHTVRPCRVSHSPNAKGIHSSWYDCELMKHTKYAHHYFSTSREIIKLSCTLRQNTATFNSVWIVSCLINVMEIQSVFSKKNIRTFVLIFTSTGADCESYIYRGNHKMHLWMDGRMDGKSKTQWKCYWLFQPI